MADNTDYFRDYYETIPNAAKNRQGRTLDIHRFASFRQYVDYVEKRLEFTGGSPSDSSLQRNAVKFRGEGEGLDGVIALARSGWENGRDMISGFASRLTGAVGNRILEDVPIWDVAGSEVDMDRYLEGNPECMIDYAEEIIQGKGKILSIAYDFDVVNYVPTESIMLHGAMVAGLIDCLEYTGFSVELWGVHVNHVVMETQVKVKDAGEALDLDTLAFVSIHPGMFRRFEFAHMEMQTAHDRHLLGVGNGYGAVDNGAPNITTDIEFPNNDRFYNDVWKKHNTQEARESAAIEWIVSALAELGVEVEV